MRRMTFALVMLLAAPLATAQVYKWKDSQGTAHYSETPPPAGVPYTRIRSVSADPVVPAASDQPTDTNSQADAGGSVPDTQNNREDLCKKLSNNLSVLRGSAPVIMEKDGKPTALDADQRQAQLQQAQTQYQQFCSQ